MDGSKQVCGLGEVLESQFKEQFFIGLAFLELLANRCVIGGALLDSVLENCRVRGQPRHRQLVNVVLKRAARQQVAGDVVEPETLAQVVEQLSCFHRVTSKKN